MNEKKLKSEKIIVFSGPTLSGVKALKLSLSHKYVFHPPIRCGNLIEAYNEGFRIAIIVDGFFETTASVWHKEILYFIQRGGRVIGCSSMGVLRALELDGYGMIGFGQIFKDFKSGAILDDDEVTVAHLGQNHDFLPLTDAMVNIRYTVKEAHLKGLLSTAQMNKIINSSKDTFYKKRNLKLLIEELVKSDNDLIAFKNYIETNGIIDQKKNDALILIKNFDSIIIEFCPNTNNFLNESLNYTRFFQMLSSYINITAPGLDLVALSPDTKLLKLGRLLAGKHYSLITQLAGAMSIFSNFKSKPNIKSIRPCWMPIEWIAQNEFLDNLLGSALTLCPDYLEPNKIPETVRYLCMANEFVLEDLDPSITGLNSNHFNFNSTDFFSRLIFLISLFIDARNAIDPITSRFQPPRHLVELRLRYYIRRGFDLEENRKKMEQFFGLHDLGQSAVSIERINLLLQTPPNVATFDFLDEGVPWFRFACQLSGVWHGLLTLLNLESRMAFSQDVAINLQKLTPEDRARILITAGLTEAIVDEQKIIKYIEEHLVS